MNCSGGKKEVSCVHWLCVLCDTCSKVVKHVSAYQQNSSGVLVWGLRCVVLCRPSIQGWTHSLRLTDHVLKVSGAHMQSTPAVEGTDPVTFYHITTSTNTALHGPTQQHGMQVSWLCLYMWPFVKPLHTSLPWHTATSYCYSCSSSLSSLTHCPLIVSYPTHSIHFAHLWQVILSSTHNLHSASIQYS